MKGDELYVPRSGKEKPGEENNILVGSTHLRKNISRAGPEETKTFSKAGEPAIKSTLSGEEEEGWGCVCGLMKCFSGITTMRQS